MTRRPIRRSVAAAAVALAVAALCAGGATAATFSDPAGDVLVAPEGAAGPSGLDLTSIEVTNTPSGELTFRVTIGNAQALAPVSAIVILLDLDKNPDTGDTGFDALVGWEKDGLGEEAFAFLRWSEAEGDFVEASQTGMAASFSGGVLTWTAPRSGLMDTAGFAFAVATLAFAVNGSSLALDVAPDGEELWIYDLQGVAPPPPPTLSASRPSGTPARPRAGKPFVVRTLVTRNDTDGLVSSGKVTCTVRIGSTRLRAAGRFSGATARCAMTVPRTAKGKKLRGTITVSALGASVKKSFAFRVG